MPLDPLQDRIARTALALPEAHTLALAGGAAMIAHGFVSRETKDVDLFTEIDDQEAVRVAAALRRALGQQGLETQDSKRPPFDHQFVAVDPASGAECTVEVLPDGGRLRPRVLLDIGPVLHPDDLAADKVLALWGRARPRDFYDVAALRDRYRPGRLLELAATKDTGFTIETFLDALRDSVPSPGSPRPTGPRTASASRPPNGSEPCSTGGAPIWSRANRCGFYSRGPTRRGRLHNIDPDGVPSHPGPWNP